MNFTKKLLLTLLLCVGGGWLSGIVTQQSIHGWYDHLMHAPGTPPNYIFPIVWTLLYSMMAISLALLWSAPTKNKQLPFMLFGLQLGLNFAWSWIFFGLKHPGAALVDILLLWICLVATILTFRKHTQIGAYLLIPYLAWVSYAIYLNWFVFWYN